MIAQATRLFILWKEMRMSHIVKIQTEVRDASAIRAA